MPSNPPPPAPLGSDPPRSRPPRPGEAARRRPWFLLAALIVTWVAGASGATTGCTTIMFLREGTVVDVGAVAAEAAENEQATQAVATLIAAARMQATAELSHRTFPLNVAKMLLGVLLVIASGMAMAGRPNSRKLAMQAVAATVVLAIAEYALTYPIRAAWVDAVARAAGSLRLPPAEREALANRDLCFWVERVRFGVLDVGVLSAAFAVLRHPRSVAFFDAMAQLYERQREEEEEEP